MKLHGATIEVGNEVRTGDPHKDFHLDKRSKFFVGVNVGVFFKHEKAQPFQIGLNH